MRQMKLHGIEKDSIKRHKTLKGIILPIILSDLIKMSGRNENDA